MNSIKLGNIGTGAKLYMVNGKDYILLKKYIDSRVSMGATLEEVDEHLNIDRVDGRADYVLNENGEMVKLPGADLTNYYTKDETPEAIDTHLTINRTDGDENKFLTEKGTFKAVEHSSLVNKNDEADFQHVNQAEKDAIASIGDILTILNSI